MTRICNTCQGTGKVKLHNWKTGGDREQNCWACTEVKAPSAVPNGWESVIDDVRNRLQDSEPSAFDNSRYRAFAETVLDSVEEGLRAIAVIPAPTEPQTEHTLKGDGLIGKTGDKVTCTWPKIPDEPFGYFHELLDHNGNGNGVWLGTAKLEVIQQAHTKGETSEEIIALYAAPQPVGQQTKVVLELPDGDNRTAKVVFSEKKGDTLHLCIQVTKDIIDPKCPVGTNDA